MTELKNIARRLIDNATSLLLDLTNNICEQFNSVINKFISLFLRQIHKKITNKSPGMNNVY